MIRWFIMFKKKMDYAKEINDLKKRIEENESRLTAVCRWRSSLLS